MAAFDACEIGYDDMAMTARRGTTATARTTTPVMTTGTTMTLMAATSPTKRTTS